MGMMMNSLEMYDGFIGMYKNKYYVDKSMIIDKFNQLVETEDKYICITRPRRFGKTKLAYMITSYYGKEYDSRKYFDTLKIGMKDKDGTYINKSYEEFLNKYNVIFINFSLDIEEFDNIYEFIEDIKDTIKEDLKSLYPDIKIKKSLGATFKYLHETYKKKFVFVLDEWDFIFSNKRCSKEEGEAYLEFLRNLLKDKAYVAFAYMTGVLPIAKNSSGSALNMFDEYTMFENDEYSEYIGFTEKEVRELCEKNGVVSYEDLERWYNGYLNEKGEKIFNSRSVVKALNSNKLKSYWTETGPMDEIINYLKNNIADVREDVVRMVNGEKIDIKLKKYSAEKTELVTKKDIFSAMIVYGFLTYHDGMLSIPNKELMMKFESALEDESMGYISELVKKSDAMLKATLEHDTSTMTAILEYTHDIETPVLLYNDENSLSCVITLIYLNARTKYEIRREDKAGKGYVDFIFRPYNKSDKVIIMELKKGKSAKEAIEQIYSKKYYMGLKEEGYIGEILLVGINYNDKKEHECIVESLDKKKM